MIRISNRQILVFFSLLVTLNCKISFSKTLVLVPGFFNSIVPADISHDGISIYWSNEIRGVFAKAGYKVFVVNNLNPVGTIEQNGRRLLRYIKSVQSRFDGDGSFDVIAHSAGGLYTIKANDIERLPINKMLTVNTPFDGVDFIEHITQHFPGVILLEKQLNLLSLNQLRPKNIRKFLAGINESPQFPIRAYYGFQRKGRDLLDASFLSPIFYITEILMSYISDGIVTKRSALGENANIQIDANFDEYIHLDHWKQNIGADFFKFIGMTNVTYVKQEQNRFYKQLLKELN